MRITESKLRRIVREALDVSQRAEEDETQHGRSQGTAILEKLRKAILDDIPYIEEHIGLDNKQFIIDRINHSFINYHIRILLNLVLKNIITQLDQVEKKTQKERHILNRLAPNHFNFGKDGSMYQDLRSHDNPVWESVEVIRLLERFKNRVATGRYLDRLEELTNYYLDEAIKACRDLGI